MNDAISSDVSGRQLRSATVLRVREEFCELVSGDRFTRARYATHFPTPRVERLSPGHLVAVVEASGGGDVVVWRWYDAVVVGETGELVDMWEPAHGVVSARRRRTDWHPRPGSRAYLSAGLPGADWWVVDEAEVELDEVERFYTENDLWGGVT